MLACGPGDPGTGAGGGTAAVGGGIAGAGGGSAGVGGGIAGTGGGTEGVGGGSGEPRCTATTVPCQDASIQELDLFDVVNDAAITEEGTTSGEFTTLVDARAGGLVANTSYMYGRFTPSGLEKVAISDEAALESLDWDIAVRRYVIRINSGVSGPSCVEAARVPPGPTFETLTRAPGDLVWRTEAYFTEESCEYVPDTSGIGAPGTALASYWEYSSCLQMTNNVFVLHLRDGRYVKLQVLGYYDLPAQAVCDETGTAPIPSGSGNVRVRWAFIDGPQP